MQSGAPLVRSRSYRLLCQLLGVDFAFDPNADEVHRAQEVSIIRAALGRRRAG